MTGLQLILQFGPAEDVTTQNMDFFNQFCPSFAKLRYIVLAKSHAPK
jgi:hypothetical protein